MIWLLFGAFALAVVVIASRIFVRLDAAAVAKTARVLAAVLGLLGGGFLVMRGAVGLGAPLALMGLAALGTYFAGVAPPRGERGGRGQEPPRDARSVDMTVEEAFAVLGLELTASAAEIAAAHRRLIAKLHPDTGGSSWLAAKLNRAKEIALAARD